MIVSVVFHNAVDFSWCMIYNYTVCCGVFSVTSCHCRGADGARMWELWPLFWRSPPLLQVGLLWLRYVCVCWSVGNARVISDYVCRDIQGAETLECSWISLNVLESYFCLKMILLCEIFWRGSWQYIIKPRSLAPVNYDNCVAESLKRVLNLS